MSQNSINTDEPFLYLPPCCYIFPPSKKKTYSIFLQKLTKKLMIGPPKKEVKLKNQQNRNVTKFYKY